MSTKPPRAVQLIRNAFGRRLHSIIDARIAEKRASFEADIVARIRHASLRDYQVFGPTDRLQIASSAEVNDALFNTTSGLISVAGQAFFGHGVGLLTGTHDMNQFGAARRSAIPSGGRDIYIGAGAWIASRATVLGPCRVGENAVVCAGAVVTGDVAAGTVVAGVPARRIRSLNLGIPPALDIAVDGGRLYVHSRGSDERIHAEVLQTPEAGVVAIRELARPGTTIVDAGAKVGYAALSGAEAGARVIAIEPDPANVALLRANVMRNELDVEVIAAAAWNRASRTSLRWSCPSTDGAVGITRDEALKCLTTVTIDEVIPTDAEVSVIKLDVQGNEHVALEGARATVKRCRPVLLITFWPQGIRDREEDPSQVLATYASFGYRRKILELPGRVAAHDEDVIAVADARPAPFEGAVTLRLDPPE